MAAINCLSTLAKLRTQIGKIVLEAMISWTPAALAEQSHVQVRNVEKTVRLLFFHFLRYVNGSVRSPRSSFMLGD